MFEHIASKIPCQQAITFSLQDSPVYILRAETQPLEQMCSVSRLRDFSGIISFCPFSIVQKSFERPEVILC